MKTLISWRAAVIGAACVTASAASAAAPEMLEPETAGVEAAAGAPVTVYELETEMVVRNWVLCFSAAVAEQLVRAREESLEKAVSAYRDLQEARFCGRVPELRVILQERLYTAADASGHDARAYGALVSLADKWASAYLVYGGLPEPQ